MGLLDFSKAFDSVNHNLLCNKLKLYFGFSNSSLSLIRSYLSDRVQKVRLEHCTSSALHIISGVPQGSILGPLLFSMFINDIFSLCKFSNIHGYADDIQLYISNRIGLVEDLSYKLNDDIEAIRIWAQRNHLKLNPDKSCVLPIKHGGFDLESLPTVFLGNTSLKFVSKTKYLGFHINSYLDCKDHINSVVSKIYLTLRNLRITGSFIPTELKRKLVIQLIVPHITYAAEVYSKLDSLSLHKLQVSFNNATRYVFNLRKYSSISSYNKIILGINLQDYLCYRNLLFLHRILTYKAPHYLYEKLAIGTSSRCKMLILPELKHLNSSRLFFINAIRLWNSLPTTIRLINNASSFKKCLFDLYKT